MIDQCIKPVLDNCDSIRVGDLIKIQPVMGSRRHVEDYYLVLTIDEDTWKALFNGKIVTMSGMTSTKAPDIIVSRPT